MKRRKTTPARTSDSAPLAATNPSTTSSKYPWMSLLLCGYVAFLTALTPLIGSEGPVGRGVELPWVAMWIWGLALWATAGMLEGSLTIYWSKWESLLLALVAWLAIGVPMVAGSGEVRPAINQFWTYTALVIAYFLYRQLFRTEVRKRAITAVLTATVTLCATYAVYQYRIEIPQMQADYQADPEKARREAGITGDDDDPQVKNFESRLMSTEPSSTFTLTNSLAGFLAVGLIVTAGIAISQVRDRAYLHAAILAVVVCLLCGTLILTKSRTAVLAAMVGIGLWGVLASSLRRHLPWKYLVAGVLLLVIAVGGGFASGLLDREVFTEAPKSILYRLQYWQGALDVTSERPLFGCGLGNFQSFYPRYMAASASETVADPHNFLLEIVASAGVPALLFFLGFIAVWLFRFPTGGPAEEIAESEAESVEETDGMSVVAIYAGMLFAFLVAPLVRALMQEESPTWAIWLGVPLAAIVALATYQWSQRGKFDWLTLRIAAIVLMINLLAAGGVSFPAVAIWLWLIWGLTFGDADDQGWRIERFLPRACVAAGTVALLFIMARSSLFPVMTSYTYFYGAMVSNFPDQIRLAKDASAADPYSSEGPQLLANSFLQAWKLRPDPPIVAGAKQATEETLKRSPRSATLQNWFAKHYWELYRKYEDPAILQLAIERQEAACRNFPTRGYYHAELAQMYSAAGRKEDAAKEAREALRLNESHDHSELKFEKRTFDDGQSVLKAVQELAQPQAEEKNQASES
ncbi:O-antigen ligase family protein [Blastopirellula sp. JC732]|uniref:O-antigen ligase family protein n=1 Tax=Blastopirellula sediminis TaxID=2894196 RepID=A0A9X1MQU8_9BACT|nr:O-antigen ligase family protein [Blastopirellula sediminis]MCC9605934.1 O-antigen ligase family protein [Blastopirellula sediminis]MCC9630767.1 O-antigen ligase family protein [Blastopirellula sediminis]